MDEYYFFLLFLLTADFSLQLAFFWLLILLSLHLRPPRLGFVLLGLTDDWGFHLWGSLYLLGLGRFFYFVSQSWEELVHVLLQLGWFVAGFVHESLLVLLISEGHLGFVNLCLLGFSFLFIQVWEIVLVFVVYDRRFLLETSELDHRLLLDLFFLLLLEFGLLVQSH